MCVRVCDSLTDSEVECSSMIPAMKRLTRGESNGVWVVEEGGGGVPLIVGSYVSGVLVLIVALGAV